MMIYDEVDEFWSNMELFLAKYLRHYDFGRFRKKWDGPVTKNFEEPHKSQQKPFHYTGCLMGIPL